jgi:hypothetical protein
MQAFALSPFAMLGLPARWLVGVWAMLMISGMSLDLVRHAMGQDPQTVPPGGMMPPENVPRVVGPGVLPDLMYMRNQKGEEILVPRARYEDFERILMETELGSEGLAATPSLNQLDLSIEPKSDYADIQVRGWISLKRPNRTTWTVPIALGQLQWMPSDPASGPKARDPQEEATADGIESIATSLQANGYLWRLGPGKSLQRRLDLDAVCRVNSSASSSTLRLDLPPAATVVKLKLPKGNWELNATGGGNEVIEPFQEQGEYSVAIVRTSSSSINLTWSLKETREPSAAIEVFSQTKFSPSGDVNRWRADSALAIRGPIKLGGKRIRWILPAQGVLREANSNIIRFPNYRLVRAKPGDQPPLSAVPSIAPLAPDPISLTGQPSIEAWWIEIDEPYSRSELDLNLEWDLSRASSESQVAFESPRLDGIERHSGTIEFAIPRTNSIDWFPLGQVKLTRQSQASDGSESIVYSFQFEGQNAGVATKWTSIVDRPRIVSEQRVEVRENQLLLRGGMEFGSDPIQLPLLQLEVEGWKPERIVLYPSEIDIPLDSIVYAAGNATENPLQAWSLPIGANLWIRSTSAIRPGSTEPSRAERNTDLFPGIKTYGNNPISNPLEILATSTDKKETNTTRRIEYFFSRTLEASDAQVAYSLPRLSWLSQEAQQRVTRNVPGRLLVMSWPFRLASDTASSSGLMETSLDRVTQKQFLDGNSSITNPFIMQFQITDSNLPLKWAGKRIRKGSFVSAILSTSAYLEKDTIEWNARWECKCIGSRPTELMLGLPSGSTEDSKQQSISDLELKIDGRAVEASWAAMDPQSSSKYRWAKISVPEVPVDGSHRLDFMLESKFTTQAPNQTGSEQSLAFDAGLPQLKPTGQFEQILLEEIEFRTLDSPEFTLVRSDETKAQETLIDPDQQQVTLVATKRLSTLQTPVRLYGQWIQTIVNAIEQRDRYVARFQTDQRTIQIKVEHDRIRDSEWVLDGQRAAVREDTQHEGEAIITIPESEQNTGDSYHVLEVYTSKSAVGGWLRHVQPIGPRLESSAASTPLVWQIIVPRTEHLVFTSRNALPMYQWRWSDLFLRRLGDLQQEQIEERFGATKQPMLAKQVNQYDLTSIGANQPLEATFIPAAMIWLPVSSIVLLLAGVLRGNRWIRWPWFWAVFFASYFVFSQVAWDISLLVLQAACVSVALALLYGIASWLMDRKARRRSIFVSRQYKPSTPVGKLEPISNANRKATQEVAALKSTVTVQTREPQ